MIQSSNNSHLNQHFRYLSIQLGVIILFLPKLLSVFSYDAERWMSKESSHYSPLHFLHWSHSDLVKFIRSYLSLVVFTYNQKKRYIPCCGPQGHPWTRLYFSLQPDFAPFTPLIQLYHYFFGFLHPLFLFFNLSLNPIFKRSFLWHSIQVVPGTLCTIF